MNKPNYLMFAVVPGLLLLVVSIVRSRLEISDPEGALTHAMSVNYPTVLILLAWPFLMLKQGLSLKQYVGVMAVALLFIRLPLAVIYALATAQEWTVEATGEPVRYITDVTQNGETPGAVMVFIMTFLFPFVFGLLFSVVTWSINWAVGFKGKRPFSAAPAA